MKLRSQFFLFFLIALFTSIAVFVGLSVYSYTQDKISFVKEKAAQEVETLSRQLADLVVSNGQAIVYDERVQRLFERDDLAKRFLIDKNGVILAGQQDLLGKSFADTVSINSLSRINLSSFASGLFEGKGNSSEAILVAYSSVSETSHFVIQVYKISEINRFLFLFMIKIIFAFLCVTSFFVMIGYVAVNNLTRGLEVLSASADQFGAGDFNHRVEIRGRNEVASLAAHFNDMAEKIQESLKLEEEKARLKVEMEMAQKVQETLFLKPSYQKGGITIAAHYEPASECGGDWWYYFETQDSVWICIGDVTGHGVGPAMLTSAVRSAFGFISKVPDLTPAKALKLLNESVCETVNGKLNMTFSIVQICEEKSFVRYSSASHEFPILIQQGAALKKNDIVFLDESKGSRLGESLASTYVDSELVIQSSSRIIFYSDGICDVQNSKQESFGERRFIKSILGKNESNFNTEKFVSDILLEVNTFREATSLIDDVSLLVVDIKSQIR